MYWTINQYSTACVKRWSCLEYVYSLMHCLVLLLSIALVINKQWALLNDCWINTYSRYLGFIRTHPTEYNRLCIWLAVSPYMNGCAWLRARWSFTLYHSTFFNPSRKITLRLITTTNIPITSQQIRKFSSRLSSLWIASLSFTQLYLPWALVILRSQNPSHIWHSQGPNRLTCWTSYLHLIKVMSH